ncbi:hypothetical protein Hanom_Chr07g00629861 [Helianthus anomalus]
MTHNPACDNLQHLPRWSLVQGSRMDNLDNCHKFYSMSLPSVEWVYPKNWDRFRLLDDHVCSGVNFFATTQDIVREWRSMGEDLMEFENARHEFPAEREAFNVEKKGLNWRVLNVEDKFAKEKKLNFERQEQWTVACNRSNQTIVGFYHSQLVCQSLVFGPCTILKQLSSYSS